jgi:hypothetical protein
VGLGNPARSNPYSRGGSGGINPLATGHRWIAPHDHAPGKAACSCSPPRTPFPRPFARKRERLGGQLGDGHGVAGDLARRPGRAQATCAPQKRNAQASPRSQHEYAHLDSARGPHCYHPYQDNGDPHHSNHGRGTGLHNAHHSDRSHDPDHAGPFGAMTVRAARSAQRRPAAGERDVLRGGGPIGEEGLVRFHPPEGDGRPSALNL